MVAQRAAVGQLVELGHSVFHKFGRLQDEWVCILPIVIHRILTQYQDIQNYKKVGVCLLTYHPPSLSHRESWENWSILWAATLVEGKRLDQSSRHHCSRGGCSSSSVQHSEVDQSSGLPLLRPAQKFGLHQCRNSTLGSLSIMLMLMFPVSTYCRSFAINAQMEELFVPNIFILMMTLDTIYVLLHHLPWPLINLASCLLSCFH